MKSLCTLILLLFASLYSIGQHNADLETNKAAYRVGEPVVLNFSIETPLNTGSWVGLYHSSTSRSGSSGYMDYKYINDAKTATFNFDAPDESGEYEFRVYDSNPEILITSTSFKVNNIDPREIMLAIVSPKLSPGKNFEIRMESELEFNPKAWLGIYKSNADINQISGYLAYQYVSGMKGNLFTLQVPMEPGEYDLRLFTSDYGKMIKRIPFIVGELDLPGLKYTLNKEDYGPGEDIIVDYTGHEDLTSNSWFGIYDQKNELGTIHGYLEYRYLRNKTGGQIILKAPSQKGEYDVRFFYTDSGPILLEPIDFTVNSSIDESYIKKTIESDGRIALYGIYFDTNKSIVKAESYPLIEQIAEMLNSDPSMKIRIEGHTDSEGEATYNQELSEKRAKSIFDLLVSKYKVSGQQLETKGFGESTPVGDNNSPAGRAQNRRVELVKI